MLSALFRNVPLEYFLSQTQDGHRTLLGTEAQLTWMQGAVIPNHLVSLPHEHSAITLGHTFSSKIERDISCKCMQHLSNSILTAGRGHHGSAGSSESHCMVKQLPPQEAFQGLSIRSFECEFSISSLSAQKLSMPFPSVPAPSFPVSPFHNLSEVSHSLLQLLLLPPACQHFPTTQAVHTLNTDLLVKQSSNYLTCLYIGVCSFTKPRV